MTLSSMPTLGDWIDAETATVAGVGEVLELASELAQAAASLLTSYEHEIRDPAARRRVAQALMLLEVAAETVDKALDHHDHPGRPA